MQALEKTLLLNVFAKRRQRIGFALKGINNAVNEEINKEHSGGNGNGPFDQGKELARQENYYQGEDKEQPDPDCLSGVKEDQGILALKEEEQGEKWGEIADCGPYFAVKYWFHPDPSWFNLDSLFRHRSAFSLSQAEF